jgi:hypothetical protein
VERQGGRHRVDGDDRQIDAPADNDQRHADAENAQSGDGAHEVENIARAQEAPERERENAEQGDRN